MLKPIGEKLIKRLKKTLNFFNKKKYYSNLNIVKLVYNKKKYHFNINQLKFEKSEIREIKTKIVNFYFRNLELNNSLKQHLFNYFLVKNIYIIKKASLIKYLVDKKIRFNIISSSFLLKDDIHVLKSFNIDVKEIRNNNKNLNPISIFLWFIHQFFEYKLFFKYFSEKNSNFDPNIKYSNILRTWFDLAEKIFKNKLKKSLEDTIVYISPSNYKKSLKTLQRNYIKYLQSNNRNYFFYIPKVNYYYLLKLAIIIYLHPLPNHFKIPILQIIKKRIEIDDFVKHIKKIFPGVKEFYTKEEFLPESVYLTEKLKKSNIKVINLAHGLGIYGTIVNYDLFYVFTEKQKNHYYGRGSAKFKIYNFNNYFLQPNDRVIKKLGIFFVHQNIFSSFIRKTERLSKIYQEVINYIERLTKDYEVPVYAKYHPKSEKIDKILSNKINIINRIEDLPEGYRYLAITLHSSYVLELLERMPFLIINPENRMNLKEFFPDDDSIYTCRYRDFKKKIERFIENPVDYYDYWNNLISSFYDI